MRISMLYWVFVILLVCALFSGCAVTPVSAQQPVPEEFLQECVAAKRAIRNNGDLAAGYLDYKEALAACNLDKQAIRQWSDGLTGGQK